jgi:hypothetical protein
MDPSLLLGVPGPDVALAPRHRVLHVGPGDRRLKRPAPQAGLPRDSVPGRLVPRGRRHQRAALPAPFLLRRTARGSRRTERRHEHRSDSQKALRHGGPKCATSLSNGRRGGGPTRTSRVPQSSGACSARVGAVGRQIDSLHKEPPAASAAADDQAEGPDDQECHRRGPRDHGNGRDRGGDRRGRHNARMRDRVGYLLGTQLDQGALARGRARRGPEPGAVYPTDARLIINPLADGGEG